jgi:hypothetical protein
MPVLHIVGLRFKAEFSEERIRQHFEEEVRRHNSRWAGPCERGIATLKVVVRQWLATQKVRARLTPHSQALPHASNAVFCAFPPHSQVALKRRMPDLVMEWSYLPNVSLLDRADVNAGCGWVVICKL